MSCMSAGADETKLTREALKWPYSEFEIPNEVYDAFSAAGKKGQALEDEWNKVITQATLDTNMEMHLNLGVNIGHNCYPLTQIWATVSVIQIHLKI